jgi:DNA-binding NarL/FixJ family response regulator
LNQLEALKNQGGSVTLRTVLVDDVEEMRALSRSLLARDGRFTVVGEAVNGLEAIELVTALRPDVVILDIAMPLLGGMETLPRLRVVSPETRIVMHSSYPAAEMEKLSFEGGAIGYVEKSADVRAFASRLHALVAVLDTVQQVLDLTYASDLLSPRAARRDMRTALEARMEPDALATVELLTTELVTNAVQHAGSTAQVTAAVTSRGLRVAVTDGGPGVPSVRYGGPVEAESGRGLALVESLSNAWGIERSASGKAVWFEVAL